MFALKCNITRPSIKRLNGYRLIFHSALYGAGFLFTSYSICFGLEKCFPAISHYYHLFMPFAHTGKTIGAMLIGLFIWIPINKWMFTEKYWVSREITRYGDHLDELFLNAVEDKKLVQITLKSGKVYAGRIYKAFEPLSSHEYISILPVQSGFRDSETHEVKYTTNYSKAYRKYDEDTKSMEPISDKHKGLVLNVSEITAAGYFTIPLYNAFHNLPAMEEHEK